MFSPIANGISPKTVVIAVKSTGLNLVEPPVTIAAFTSSTASSYIDFKPSSSLLRWTTRLV